MRTLINAVLAFAFVLFASGLVPVSALNLGRLTEMKAELAAVQDPGLVRLRASIPQ